MRRTTRVLCISHLDWDGVWQRPQQVLSRIARFAPVLHVTEPRLDASWEGDVRVDVVAEGKNFTALRPVFPDHPLVLARWRELYVRVLRTELARRGWLGPGLTGWFYSPVAYYVVDELPFDTVVYDVMDHLAAFRGAAPDLEAREERVLAAADVVFTGGPSLFRDRRRRHDNVRLFSSGVEAAHWKSSVPSGEIAGLPHPVLGYVGVIDERVDARLLDEMARMRPDWSVVLVGPIAKIDPASLPRRPNLHYLGPRPYAQLPSLLAGCDVTLMPFALNEATRYISPTKALEYMAASRPIVATPVPDVVSQWGGTIEVAEGGRPFVDAVSRVLEESPGARAERMREQERFVRAGEWDAIVERMWQQVGQVLAAHADRAQLLGVDAVAPVA